MYLQDVDPRNDMVEVSITVLVTVGEKNPQ
jgi:hypothetical protein